MNGARAYPLHRWRALLCVAAFAVPVAAGAGAAQTDPVPPDSLAHYAPSDTAIFAEVRGMRELEQEWSQSDWGTALSSIIVGRADEPGSGNEALRPLAELLGIRDPVVVRRELLGRQVAVVLSNWADLAHGVLLAVPEQIAPVEAALAKRNVKPEAFGPVRQYRLDDHNHWLATDGRHLLLGQRHGEQSIYERSLRLLAGRDRASLANDSSFRENLAAFGPGLPRGLLYFSGAGPAAVPAGQTTRPTTTAVATRTASTIPVATLPASRPAPPATQPAGRAADRWWPASWPTLVRGAVGVTVDGPTIALSIRGQLDRSVPRHRRDANVAALNSLPATTLAAWAQPIHYPSQYQILTQGPPTFLTLYLAYIDARMKLAGTSLENGLLARLGDDTVVMLGVIPPEEQTTPTGFDIPALGVIVPVDKPAEVAATLDVVGGAVLDIFNFPGVRAKMKQPLQVARTTFGGTAISEARLGEFFRTQTACPYTHTLSLSWTVTDHDVIISTHADHIRQILRARAGQAARLGERIAAAGPLDGASPGADAVLLAQPAAIARMLNNWLDYVARTSPEVLKPEWWRLRQQRQAARISLGFGMAATRPTDVIVHNTLPGWPAHGRLQAGDRILAADGTPLGTDNPRVHLKQLIVNRKKATEITLTVEREGKRLDVLIPLPAEPISFDPVGAIQQIGKLFQPFAAGSYTVWCSPPDRFNARVVLRAAPPPATRTTTASAPAPAPPATSRPTTAPVSRPAAAASIAPTTTRAIR